MKLFAAKRLREAREYSLAGGQALHVQPGMGGAFPNTPECFRRAKEWGHLMDQDKERLVRTARKLGVKRIVVCERGRPDQHVDLCGAPLRRAKLICARKSSAGRTS